MKHVIRTVAALLGAAAFVWLTGLLLPLKHEASASIRLKATPEAVWAVLSAVENYPGWRSDVATSELIGGKPGISWRETDARGLMMVHAAGHCRPVTKWIDCLVKGDSPRTGERIFLIVPEEEGGSRVALSESVDIPDPLARFRARFFTGYAQDLKTLLEDLRKRLGE